MTEIIILAKYPEPGKVKTRLGAVIGLELAADFYRIFLDCTFGIVRQSAIGKATVFYEPESRGADFRAMVPTDFRLFPQQGADLGERLSNAFERAFSNGSKKVIAVGSDSPTLPPQLLAAADLALETHDLVLGPAEDGGYCLIGLNNLYRKLFEDIEWSSDSVLDATVEQARALSLRYHFLDKWYDVDDKETLLRAAADDRSGAIQALVSKHPKKFVQKA